MDANRNLLPQGSSRRKVEFLACVHCNFKLVAIYQTPSGKREIAVQPEVRYSVQSVLGQVTCFKCPVCGHSTIESMNPPEADQPAWVREPPHRSAGHGKAR